MLKTFRTCIMGMMALCVMTMAMTSWSEGLQATIDNVVINSEMKPEITFSLSDIEGNPLAMEDVSIRGFILAKLIVADENGSAYYWSYTTRTQTVPEGKPNAGASAEQATYDSGGTYTMVSEGTYTYTFATAVPADYDATATHTVSGQISVEPGDEEEGDSFYANPVYHFVPDGSEVVNLRQVVTTEGCNECHTGMGIHGGGRRAIELCILCHSPQSVDPDTGNSVDMTEMIHKIHMGSELPSVQAGGEYKIVGYRQSVHDYTNVVFPTDNRNCTICHTGPQEDVYKTAVNRRSCGSCHDDIDFAAGEGHLIQEDDSGCTQCHPAEGDEFGLSVAGAHVIQRNSEQVEGINAEITNVENAASGQAPIISFTLKNDAGDMIAIEDLRSIRILMGGPTQEYTHYQRVDVLDVTPTITIDGDVYTVPSPDPLPEDAEGTYTFGMEIRRSVEVNGENITEQAPNPIFLAAVTGDEITPRREVVSQDSCLDCHVEFTLHGTQRNQVDYCLICHHPKESDVPERPEGVTGGESVSFGYMIHKIHRGAALENGYLVYGYRSSVHDYSDLVFPGKNNVCGICHIDSIPELPLPDEVEPIEFENVSGEQVFIARTTAICTSCHDDSEAVSHAADHTEADGTETCANCHGVGSFADIANFHGQSEFLHVDETIAPPGSFIEGWMMR